MGSKQDLPTKTSDSAHANEHGRPDIKQTDLEDKNRVTNKPKNKSISDTSLNKHQQESFSHSKSFSADLGKEREMLIEKKKSNFANIRSVSMDTNAKSSKKNKACTSSCFYENIFQKKENMKSMGLNNFFDSFFEKKTGIKFPKSVSFDKSMLIDKSFPSNSYYLPVMLSISDSTTTSVNTSHSLIHGSKAYTDGRTIIIEEEELEESDDCLAVSVEENVEAKKLYNYITKARERNSKHKKDLELSRDNSFMTVSTSSSIASKENIQNKSGNVLPIISDCVSVYTDINNNTSNPRNTYYTKLVVKNVLPTQTPPSAIAANKIFIFDWDDTFFCTSYLAPHGQIKDNLNISERDTRILKELETLVFEILSFAISKGDTFIITNAEKGWVEHSIELFYPKLIPLLDNIIIISARNLYEKRFPKQMMQWKLNTFLRLTEIFDAKLITNLVCMGDSESEIEACQMLSSKFRNVYLKSIKLRENPKPDELIKQLNLVKNQIEGLYSKLTNVTVNVEKKSKMKK